MRSAILLLLALLPLGSLACGAGEPVEEPEQHTFRVTVEGRNHEIRVGDTSRRVAFSADRTVRARDREEAIDRALDLVRSDPVWIGVLANRDSRDDPPLLCAGEVERLPDDEPEPSPGLDYEFHDDARPGS